MEVISYPLRYFRQKTRVVSIGAIKIGGSYPIYAQSMLSSATSNLLDCLKEIRSLTDVNCRLIRLAVPSARDLEAIPELKRLLKEEGLAVSLVADIHFSPRLAVDACEYFEKIRINPGNYSDIPRSSKQILDGDYFLEGRQKLEEEIKPLVHSLKKYQRALRIGVNQGSLSKRMIERYGDSPIGMVQSALEMIELFEKNEFTQLVVSLKSSNPLIVQRAYRLFVQRQLSENAVPLHLGVTEAGEGLMGRIKSLTGIGVLLADGIGDTIRVSLAEPGANEIRFARELLDEYLPKKHSHSDHSNDHWVRPADHHRTTTRTVRTGNQLIGGGESLKIGCLEQAVLPDIDIPVVPDFFFRKERQFIYLKDAIDPMIQLDSYQIDSDKLKTTSVPLLIKSELSLFELRRFISQFSDSKTVPPVGLLYSADEKVDIGREIQLAGMLGEGLIDFLLLPENIGKAAFERLVYLLQATRSRIFFTDYIICPSCGRTLFDLKSTVEKIKEQTNHLKGLKIGIMGCVVNGKGEMADADFGYVGSGPGKIDLYCGQERVVRAVKEKDAVKELIKLIKKKGKWKDPV